MLRFLVKQRGRTCVAHLDTIHFDEGRSRIKFHPQISRDKFLVTNRLPPASTAEPNAPNCALCPPLHWHRYQVETFHVISGRAKFFLDNFDDGHACFADEDDTVVIEKGRFHTFRNTSTTDELVIEFGLTPSFSTNDERYFRNIQTYRDDCRKAGVQRSMFQVLLFNYYGNVVLGLPGPAGFAKTLGVMLNFFGGVVIGQWVLGYRGTYEEYYDRERISNYD